MINPPQLFRSTSARLLLVVVIVALAVGSGIAIASALRDDKPAPTTASAGEVNSKSLNTAVLGLCEVRTAFENNQTEVARAAFFDKAHLFLHQLAAAVEDKDRDLATTLLIAKYKVEDLLPAAGGSSVASAGDTSPPELVNQLLQQVDASATTLGLTAPSCQS